MSKFREKSKQMKKELELLLEELKSSDPKKYQELVEAEANMYKSWLMTFHPDHFSRGIYHCDLHGGHGFGSDCIECSDSVGGTAPAEAD